MSKHECCATSALATSSRDPRSLGHVLEAAALEVQLLKVNRQLTLCEGEVRELRKKLGKRIFELHTKKPGLFSDPAISTLCNHLLREFRHAAELEREFLRLREKAS